MPLLKHFYLTQLSTAVSGKFPNGEVWWINNGNINGRTNKNITWKYQWTLFWPSSPTNMHPHLPIHAKVELMTSKCVEQSKCIKINCLNLHPWSIRHTRYIKLIILCARIIYSVVQSPWRDTNFTLTVKYHWKQCWQIAKKKLEVTWNSKIDKT